MELDVVRDAPPGPGGEQPYELLAWLNDTLQTSFTRVEQVCTGAAYCQLMDLLLPGSVDLSRVCFQSKSIADATHNYSLLQAAFKQFGIKRYLPMESLIKRHFSVSLHFLQWFKVFYDKNYKGREYNALEARGGQIFAFESDDPSSQTSHQRSETPVKMSDKQDKQKEDGSECAEVIVCISDDEEDAAEGTTEQEMEQEMEQVQTVVKEDSVQVEPEARNGQDVSWDEGAVLSSFIRRYCRDNTDTNSDTWGHSLPPIFSRTHPKDIIQACSQTPYCLYLFVGVELAGGRSTSVLLIGYWDQSCGLSVLRLLHTLQLSVDTGETRSANADARFLVDTLQKFVLPLSNLVAFYCDAPFPLLSRTFESTLQALCPGMLSLCGLPGMAGRALQVGLSGSFRCVLSLIEDIHRHYSTQPSDSSGLKEVFAGSESYNPSRPVSANCLFIINAVQRIAGSWRELLDHFKSLSGGKDAGQIRDQLMDHKVKLRFLFLFQALEPLRALQELQQSDAADLAGQLQLTCSLLRSYSASILQPQFAKMFLKTWNTLHLHCLPKLLHEEDVNIGSRARDLLWATAVVDLAEPDRAAFMQSAVAFYQSVLETIVSSVPRELRNSSLMLLGNLLKHPDNIKPSMAKPLLANLVAQLGVCEPTSSEKHQVAHDFLCIIKAMKEQPRREESACCWSEIMRRAGPSGALRTFILTLLAVPTSVCRSRIFAQAFRSSKDLLDSKKTCEASLPPASQVSRSCSRVKRPSAQVALSGPEKKMKEEDEESSSEDDAPVARLASERRISQDSSDYTDNSSDIVDLTEETGWDRSRLTATKSETPPAVSVYVVSDDDDSVSSSHTKAPNSAEVKGVIGELVWAQGDGVCRWPAIISKCVEDGKMTVELYGQRMSSQVSLDALKPFPDFAQHFSSNFFAILVTYREAIFMSLQEAAVRSHKHFSVSLEDKDELLKQMLDWALAGFQPSGPEGLKPTAPTNGVTDGRPTAKKMLFLKGNSSCDCSTPTSIRSSSELRDVAASMTKLSCTPTEKTSPRGWGRGRGRGGWNRGKVQKKMSDQMGGLAADMSPDFVPYKKRTYTTKINHKVAQQSSVYTQPDQKLREETIHMIMDKKLDIEGFCLCCGTEDVDVFHPLFKGSLCRKCKDNFTETLFRYDEDGYQSYCTICCYGLEVILCGNDSCCRSYCADCLNILVGAGTFETLTLLDPWICYLCQPHRAHGALLPREDWSIRVQELFANNSGIEFEPHRVYPSVPANLRKPLRVLSLFDGIATGYLVLKELGFKVEKYVASEVCEDSVAVAAVNHDEKIIHVGDVRFITQEHISQWGPFDLLIGGSPCNDLSIVNPFRKGLYEGTGRLFFEFYRILQLLKPKEDDPRPFFWLFENVVFMNTHDKVNICRFLECNPVLVDAVNVSPAHRARCFWGNIPAMSRPIIASQSDKLNLQDCLEVGREARVTKVRTITTNQNSLKQGKDVSLLPVLHNGKEDMLWITELERIFGFPKHYTDVRNMNRQQRQKVLGKAWSVPVIRHLFAPLKDYFACEELPPVTTSTSPPSPASPELQQLR